MKLTYVTSLLSMRGTPHVTVARSAETTLELSWASLFGMVYRAYYSAQTGHWNTRGRNFASDHKFFQDQYTKLAELIDTIAEHIRTYDIELPEQLSALSSDPVTSPLADDIKYIEHYARQLLVILPKLGSICRDADKFADDASSNLGQSLVDEFKHLLWLTSSMLPEPTRATLLAESRSQKVPATQL